MDGFTTLALILGFAAIGGVAAKACKQPLLVGYILAGVIIGFLGWAPGQREILTWMGQLGVTLLLFLVGLELPVSQLKAMGRVALVSGLGQIIFTTTVGYFLLVFLGFSHATALYLGLALAFSSTVIVVKILTEKRDLQSLYGKITVGLLLIQDFVAIGLLIVLTGLGSGQGMAWQGLLWVMVKGLGLTALALWLSGQVLPKVLSWMGSSSEMLFVIAISWCLGIASLVALPQVGFNLEIGGFLAGLALSGAVQHLQIGARIRPLRDFFLTLFFVSLGANIYIGNLGSIWWLALLVSAFVLIGKPLIEMVLLSTMGYKIRTAFLASITGAQISEFSLIVAASAATLGIIGQKELALIALVGAITMVVSSYLVAAGDKLYRFLHKYLQVFEKLSLVKISRDEEKVEWTNHTVLVGYNRTGTTIYPALKALNYPVVVVDFNPQTLEKLKREEIPAVYGDLADYDLYEQLNLDEAKLVVSTVTDITDNLQFLHYLKGRKYKGLTIVTAADSADATKLYQKGADYVLIPHRVGGELVAHLLKVHGLDRKYFQKLAT